MTQMRDVFSDLATEADELDTVIGRIPEHLWAAPTPAAGWTVGDQIAHLTAVARLAGLAATDPAGFAVPARPDLASAVAAAAAGYPGEPVAATLGRWRQERARAVAALAALPPGSRVPWFGPPLRASFLAAALLLEVFAHGQDVMDGLGVARVPSDRVGHLAWLGSRTRDLGYEVHGRTPPAEPFRFDLVAPSGVSWSFGPDEATQRVSGPALDFALLVARRRRPDQVSVRAVGEHAQEWLTIAQAYPDPARTLPALDGSPP